MDRRLPRWSELREVVRPRRLPGDATDRNPGDVEVPAVAAPETVGVDEAPSAEPLTVRATRVD